MVTIKLSLETVRLFKEFSKALQPLSLTLESLNQKIKKVFDNTKQAYPYGWRLFSPSRIKNEPMGLIDELRKRTRYWADNRRNCKKYNSVTIISNNDNDQYSPILFSKELDELPNEKFYDVLGTLFDFSKSPKQIILKLESFPFNVWSLVDKEFKHIQRRQRRDVELFTNAEKVESFFAEQDKICDKLKIQRLLEQHQNKFTERQLTVTNFIYFKGWTRTSIAKDLGIDESVVREHEKAALKKLKLLFQ